jgi:hypothetical protein
MAAQEQNHPKCPMQREFCCYRESYPLAKGRTVFRCSRLTNTTGYGENHPCPFRKLKPGDLPEVMKAEKKAREEL